MLVCNFCIFFYFQECVGHQCGSLASLDLQLALHRRGTNSSRYRMLHSVHRNEPLHYFWHCNRSLLRSCDGDVCSLLEDLAGDGKASKRPAQFAGGQERQQQTQQLKVTAFILTHHVLKSSMENGNAWL